MKIKKLGIKKMNITTERLYFSTWEDSDLDLALKLWGNPTVAKYIHKNGFFSERECSERLKLEIYNLKKKNIQYFPVFLNKNKQFVGVCGFRPTDDDNRVEFGVHFLPEFWHRGLAYEASAAMLNYAFKTLKISSVIAGHNPHNSASQNLLYKLGFKFIKNEYYEPTGLEHPTYMLNQ
ncbi:GNAT family N-acetyltransferase [Leuconostoc pseudomesenteroides]|uniref:GNAT family N-acetyltransferase n=1 Tax=Leuconostoc pseudomesenteroides TaxID=33968 RepID=UPI00301E624B